MNGVTAFREAFVASGDSLSDPMGAEFSHFAARKFRYAMYEAFFANDQYRNFHSWARQYKIDFGLYKYTRGIYNPSFRLCSFWQSHLWGGLLDAEAGDGEARPSALPIETDNEPLRAAIAQLWQDSNWQVRKDIVTLQGSMKGDVAIRVVDDTERGRVYLQAVMPHTIRDVTLDAFGNVKGYELVEVRPDPRGNNAKVGMPVVTYSEIATRDGDEVVYQTFLDDDLYAWNPEQGAEWREQYGFIPLVVIKHNDIGLEWGWSELHAGRAKFSEADDLASKIGDQIRKHVEAPWLFAGVSKPTTKQIARGDTDTSESDAVGREEIPVFYGPIGATATPLVASLNLADSDAHIREILDELERDFPELKADQLRLSGALSGRALELAQQPAADKVLQRRPNYDNALVRAHQMAVAIGGFRKYDGFAGFDLNSFDAGNLDHSIGHRDVFRRSEGDRLDAQTALWTAAGLATSAGYLLVDFLRDNNFTDEQLAPYLAQADTVPTNPLGQ